MQADKEGVRPRAEDAQNLLLPHDGPLLLLAQDVVLVAHLDCTHRQTCRVKGGTLTLSRGRSTRPKPSGQPRADTY